MYTLAFPLVLADDRGFDMDQPVPVPPIAGHLALSCLDGAREAPQAFRLSGFPSEEAAESFAPLLASAVRCASLSLGRGLQPSDMLPTTTDVGHYDVQFPTVFKTDLKALPVTATFHASVVMHVSTLAQQLESEISSGNAQALLDRPELLVAVKLYSELPFVGGYVAQFVVLMSALEVLVSGKGNKRTRVCNLVFDTFKKLGRDDAKEVRKQLHTLYELRNAVLHEAAAATIADVAALASVVRDTLKGLVARR